MSEMSECETKPERLASRIRQMQVVESDRIKLLEMAMRVFLKFANREELDELEGSLYTSALDLLVEGFQAGPSPQELVEIRVESIFK